MLRAAAKALVARKHGPSLYDLCDPLLRNPGKGDAHLRTFYRTALANPALRPLLARAGLPQLSDPARRRAVQDAIVQARDASAPDWAAVGRPIADLIDQLPQSHPHRSRAAAVHRTPSSADIDGIIRSCAAHLLRSFRRNGFLPAYAAFNLAGDPDLRGRDLVTTLTGFNARTYKNATLLFNLARACIVANRSLAALINPPWRGIAEPLWEPVQIRHRSAYYDAFFAEALMDYLSSGLASAEETSAARLAINQLIGFCLNESRENVLDPRDGRPTCVVTAIAPPPHACISRFFRNLKRDLGFGTFVCDFDTTVCALSAAARFGFEHPMLDQPLLDFIAGYQIGEDSQFPVTVGINDTIDYSGGIVTGSKAPAAISRSETISTPPLISTYWKSPSATMCGGASRPRRNASRCCGESSVSRRRWSRPARGPIRARTFTTCRNSIAPISGAVMRPSARCPKRRRTRSTPRAPSYGFVAPCSPMFTKT